MHGFKETQIRLIEKTNNPLAGIVFNNIFNGIEQTARVIAPLTTKEKADEMVQRLLSDFTSEQLDKEQLARSPEFIVALLTCLKQSLIGFAQKDPLKQSCTDAQ